jgi:hypothetical protein
MIRTASALAFLVALGACSAPATAPRLAPVVDSISPGSAPPIVLERGHPMTARFPVFVCLYGKNLTGGTVHFGGRTVAADSTGCGGLTFAAPADSVGTFAVFVTTDAGTSNAVSFVRP